MAGKHQGTVTSLLTAPFVISVAILGVTAVGLPWATHVMRIVLTKEAIRLRSPLPRLDKGGLGPYVFRDKQDLDTAVVEALGTNEYIYWRLEDTSYGASSLDPRRFARLFVTYYTGRPDPVPHTPDVCMLGSGYTTEEKENIIFAVGSLADSAEVPVRVLTFVKSGVFDSDKMTVVYTFHCNGRFAETRNAVRRMVNNPLDRHAYYSKVEVVFGWHGARPRYPSRKDVIVAAEKLLSYVLPLLVEEHWPDWAAVKRAEAGAGGGAL